MRKITTAVQFRQQARGMDEVPIRASCGRALDSGCGLKNPTECKIHAPLLLEPSREEANRASAKARAMAATIAAGFGNAPRY
jgi:hypothetical protein